MLKEVFTLQELKKNLQSVIAVDSEGEQHKVIEDTKRQPDETQERLKIFK